MKLGNPVPLDGSHGDIGATKRRYDETLGFDVVSYQRSFIHGRTPSGPATALYMSLPFNPDVLYRLSSVQSFTVLQFASKTLFAPISLFNCASSPAKLSSLSSSWVYSFRMYSALAGNSNRFVFLAMQALSAHSTA